MGQLTNQAAMTRTHAKYVEAIRQGGKALWELHVTEDSESFAEAYQRFINELKQIAQNHLGEKIIVISHGGLMRVLLVKLGFASLKELVAGEIENTAIIKLRYSADEFSLIGVQGIYLAEK